MCARLGEYINRREHQCGDDEQFRRFCGVLGANWYEDPRFSTNPGRVRGRDQLVPLIAARMAERSKDELLAALQATMVPAGPINDLPEVFADPQVVHRGMVNARKSSVAGATPTPALCSPIVIDGVRQVAGGLAPTLGQDNDMGLKTWLARRSQNEP